MTATCELMKPLTTVCKDETFESFSKGMHHDNFRSTEFRLEVWDVDALGPIPSSTGVWSGLGKELRGRNNHLSLDLSKT